MSDEKYSVEEKLNKLKNNAPKLRGHSEFKPVEIEEDDEDEDEIQEVDIQQLKEKQLKSSSLNKNCQSQVKRNTNCKLNGGNK